MKEDTGLCSSSLGICRLVNIIVVLYLLFSLPAENMTQSCYKLRLEKWNRVLGMTKVIYLQVNTRKYSCLATKFELQPLNWRESRTSS
jgi:hypothetical protein